MRKLFLITLSLVAICVQARKIYPDEAASIAATFLNVDNSRHNKSVVRLAKSKAKQSQSENAQEAEPYYVFNNTAGEGFVIISGDDRAKKILGYSDKGNFDCDNMPPQLKGLLEQYTKQIESLPESAATDSSWTEQSTSLSNETGGVILETANWGQGYPYNAQCPIIDGVQAPTGCVATAMAIVMKYHNWPGGYDWSAMPMDTPETPVESLSKLMTDAGKAVLMNYGPYESGANMNWVGHKLQQDFKYSPECQFISSSNFSEDDWLSMLKDNLDNGNPVIYNGSGTGGNHAFIIDGYNAYGHHVNWGWDGICNGYFALNTLTPNEVQDFSNNIGMVVNIVPDKSGKEYSKVFCDYGYFWALCGLVSGSHFSIDTPKQNDRFDYTCYILSYPCDYSGQLGLLLFDKDGNVKEVLKTIPITESRDDFGFGLWGNDISFKDVAITSSVEPDDYITLATQKTLSNPWCEVLGTYEAPVKRYVTDIKKDIGTIKIINNVPDTHISYIKLLSDWADLEGDVVECVKGGQFNMVVKDEEGRGCENIVITVEGKDVYGNTSIFYEGSAWFEVYSDNYTITIDKNTEGEEKVIDLSQPGSLSEALKDTSPLNIGSLSVSGSINAVDIWFIRDNLKQLSYLDLSHTKILASEAIDPVEAFRIGITEFADDELPTHALTFLSQLKTLKLPKELKHIDSSSLMGLAISDIELPATLLSIGLNVFFDCSQLNTIICKMSQAPYINDCVFSGTLCPANGMLYVPVGASDSYRNTPVWQEFAQIVENNDPILGDQTVIHEGVKYRIHGNALYVAGYVQSELPEDVIIPDNITLNGSEYTVLGIDENAMYNAKMKSLVMANSITTVGGFLFQGSTVKKVVMSDNITEIPFSCIDGEFIEELHLPENAKLICNSIYCYALKKLHLPKKLKSKIGYNGSLGYGFRCLEEITVDPENEEWSVHDGILYWKGLSHMILVPNNYTGELVIPNETITINRIANCNSVTEIIIGNGIKSLNYCGIHKCYNLKHIEFNKDIIFSSNNVIDDLPCLESFTMRDFIWSYDYCFCNLPSLKYVYLLNENPIDFGKKFYKNVNPEHEYFSYSLTPKALVPDGCYINVPGGTTNNYLEVNPKVKEMWSYVIDKEHRLIRIIAQCEDLAIDKVIINGVETTSGRDYLYNIPTTNDLDVVIDYTLHGRQTMTTHYDAVFNASLPNTDLSKVTEIVLNESEANLYVGQSIKLSATVSPEYALNKSIIWSSSNEVVATVDADGKVTAVGVGTAIITATAADGSGVSASCMVEVYLPDKGDSNANGVVNIADAVNTANYAVGMEVERFCFEAADVNSDERITLSDASGTVTIILDQPAEPTIASMFKKPAMSEDITADCLVIGGLKSMDGKAIIPVTLDNTVDYVALQGEVTVPEGMELIAVNSGDRIAGSHSLMTKRIDSRTMRVALFDMNNRAFINTEEALFELIVRGGNSNSGNIEIRNIVASDAAANEYILKSSGGSIPGTSGIDDIQGGEVQIETADGEIRLLNACGREIAVYSVDGRIVARFTAVSDRESRNVESGMYIIAVGDKVSSVIVK